MVKIKYLRSLKQTYQVRRTKIENHFKHTCQIDEIDDTSFLGLLAHVILGDLIELDGDHCVSSGACCVHLSRCHCSVRSTCQQRYSVSQNNHDAQSM